MSHHYLLQQERDGESKLQRNDEMVLQALEPHPNLQVLDIIGFKGIHFPPWLSSLVLNNVVSIGLLNFDRCLELPPLREATVSETS